MDEEDWDEQMTEIKKRHNDYLKANSRQSHEKLIIASLFICCIVGLVTLLWMARGK